MGKNRHPYVSPADRLEVERRKQNTTMTLTRGYGLEGEKHIIEDGEIFFDMEGKGILMGVYQGPDKPVKAVEIVVDGSAGASYSIVDVSDGSALKRYQLYKNGSPVDGSIVDIPAGMTVKRASIYTAHAGSDAEYPGNSFVVGKRYLHLEMNDATGSHVFIDVSDLSTYAMTGSEYIDVSSGGTITLKYDDLRSAIMGSVVGEGAIKVNAGASTLTVNLLIKNDAEGDPLKGNVRFTQNVSDGLVGEILWE